MKSNTNLRKPQKCKIRRSKVKILVDKNLKKNIRPHTAPPKPSSRFHQSNWMHWNTVGMKQGKGSVWPRGEEGKMMDVAAWRMLSGVYCSSRWKGKCALFCSGLRNRKTGDRPILADSWCPPIAKPRFPVSMAQWFPQWSRAPAKTLPAKHWTHNSQLFIEILQFENSNEINLNFF